jgi:hypothetical protein
LINEVVAKVKEAVEEGRAETVQVLSALIRTASGFEEIESGLETPEE